MNNLPSYCGLVDAKIRAYDKDLPVAPASPSCTAIPLPTPLLAPVTRQILPVSAILESKLIGILKIF